MVKHEWYKEEIKDLLKAWFVLSLAFAILLTGLKFSMMFFLNFTISAITVGLGFLLHEMAHKFMAERYGCKAIFKADPIMLGVTLISSLFGFIFAAPGGVYIIGSLSSKRNGIISLAGPLTNIILAFIFMASWLLSDIAFVQIISSYGLLINAWIGAFNMIPFGPFDGKKILDWNKPIYVVVTAVAVGLVFFRFMI